jgi:hypothetical protein
MPSWRRFFSAARTSPRGWERFHLTTIRALPKASNGEGKHRVDAEQIQRQMSVTRPSIDRKLDRLVTRTPAAWYPACSHYRRRHHMDERNPRNDENMDDRIDENIDDRTNEDNLVDKSDDAEEFEDIEESDEEDVEEE